VTRRGTGGERTGGASTSARSAPKAPAFYDHPNTHFNQSQQNAILNGPYCSFLY
jgi:hypothetical protein